MNGSLGQFNKKLCPHDTDAPLLSQYFKTDRWTDKHMDKGKSKCPRLKVGT